MKYFIAVFLLPLLISTPSLAEENPSTVLKRQGQLVSIELTLGEPMRIFVVGREEAKLDLSDLTLTVRRLKPYPGKILRLDKFDNYFTIAEPINSKSPMDLEVTTKVKGKSETLHFKIDNPVH